MKTKFILKKSILFLSFILISFCSFARVYYVSSSYTGATSNGNLSTPWKSLAVVQSNMSLFLPGDTISFKSGDSFSGTLTINKSGTSGNPITFNSYGLGNKPKLTGTGSAITYLIYQYNRNYIVFDGFEITDPSISSTDRTIQSNIQRAFGFDGSSSFNVIKNCKISLVGIGTYWVGPNNTIDHCDIGNLRMVVNNVGGNNDYGANPVVISSANNTITNNYFHDCWANSYDYTYDGGAVEFYGSGSSNNFIGYNTFYDCNGVVENGSGNGGTIDNNKFVYNKFINNGSLFYINNSGAYVVTVNNMMFYNNVIIENAVNRLPSSNMASMSTSVATLGIAVFKNNIFYLNSGIDIMRSGQWTAGQLVHENNIYQLSNNSITNFTLTTSELSTSQNIWTNTTSVNPTNWDLTPISNSAAINFGQAVGLSSDFLGNSIVANPDAGIIERTSSISPLIINVNAGTISCNGGSTLVNVSATGGVAPYTGTGSFTVGAGTYNYIVKDANNTSISSSVTISQPTPINVIASYDSAISSGGYTKVFVKASGGTTPYSFQLNSGGYQLSDTFKNVAVGAYTVYVKDANSCIATKDIIINQSLLSLLSLNLIKVTNLTCRNANNGYIEVLANGGQSPYTYALNNGAFQSQSSFSNLAPGTYTVKAKDAYNAIVSFSIVIKNSRNRCGVNKTVLLNTNGKNQNNLSIFVSPNPSVQNFNLNVDSDSDEDIYIEVIDYLGRKIYTTKGGIDQSFIFGNNFNPGMYFVRLFQGNQQFVYKIIKE